MIYLANNIPVPSAFKVNANPDTLTYDEVMADPDRDCWLQSMLVEITSLESKEAWDEVFTNEARTRILPGTCEFRRKRNPDGMISKFKAQYCVRGDLQEDDSPTYDPVVAWSLVRIFSVIKMTMSWYTCSINFSNAFVQAVFWKTQFGPTFHEDFILVFLVHPVARVFVSGFRRVCTAPSLPRACGINTFSGLWSTILDFARATMMPVS